MALAKKLDIQFGKFLTPAQAANYLPGCDAKAVRSMCTGGEIEHVTKTGPNGAPRYFISERAILAWLREHTTPAA